jgi:cobalamin biosynthesis protein CbiG
MSEKAEVISQGKEGILMDILLPFIKEIREDPPVFPE